MTFTELNQDLFNMPHGYYFAHCISGDFALGAGIAVQFDKIFNMKYKLKEMWFGEGEENECLKVDNVYNLVTKRKCYEKPTYESLHEALENMKECMQEDFVTKIAMPRIGCGLDGLNWDIVKAMIKDVFSDTDVEIVICYM